MAPHKEAFLVNLWHGPHPTQTEAEQWRGSVEHVATRQRRYFTEFIDLVVFVATYLDRHKNLDGEL